MELANQLGKITVIHKWNISMKQIPVHPNHPFKLPVKFHLVLILAELFGYESYDRLARVDKVLFKQSDFSACDNLQTVRRRVNSYCWMGIVVACLTSGNAPLPSLSNRDQ